MAVSQRAKILGSLLLEEARLSERELDAALAEQRATGVRLGETLLRRGVIDGEDLARALSRQLALPYGDPPLAPDEEATRVLSSTLAKEREVLPLERGRKTLKLAMADPLDLSTLEEVEFRSGRRVEAVVASRRAIRDGIRSVYGVELRELAQELRPAPHPRSEGADDGPGGPDPGRAPAPRLLDRLLRDSVEEGASDVHLERRADGLVIRVRVDGVLRTMSSLPGSAHDAVLSRLKVLAGLDISVKRRPQDGGFPFEAGGRTLRLRVSTLPVEGGEKGVVRILDPEQAPANLEDLGFEHEPLARLRNLIRTGQGVILAAGPTGSGKSSTLFGALGEVDRERLNVVTLEDPVEYRLHGASQVQVRPRAGLTFPSALRSVLRQDPDVIMVGEIRDRETAEIAMAAAVTGHLVLSTIHTIDAPGALTRLLNMGVPPHLVAGGLSGVVAQRLVRRTCSKCFGREGACPMCIGGYRGRTGVFQVLTMSDPLREEVLREASAPTLRRRAEEGGMVSLSQDARRKVAEGVTDEHEVARVLHRDPSTPFSCRECSFPLPSRARGCPGCGLPRGRSCTCGEKLREEWRYCPHCLRKAPV